MHVQNISMFKTFKILYSARQQRIHEYYRGTYHGTPVAILMFEMASQMNRDNNDNLWMAIVGLAKQYVFEEIDTDAYDMFVQTLHDVVMSMNRTSEEITSADGTVIPSSKLFLNYSWMV